MSRKPNGPVTSSFSWPRWFKAAATISTFLVLIMLPRAAWAQRVKSDPNPEKPCVTKLAQTESMYRVAFHPYCDLRELVRTFPVLNEAGKPLPMQEQLRNIFEANKDREVAGVKVRHTVMRGCVLAGKPSPDADAEEKQYCPNGLVNYFAAPANDSIAIIEVPRSRLLTYTEKLEKLSASACNVLGTAPNPDILVRGVLANCQKLGIGALAQAAPISSTDNQSQSTPPQTQPSATTTPVASASSAPAVEPKEQPKQQNTQQTQGVGFFTALTAAIVLLVLFVLFSSRKVLRMIAKHFVSTRAKYAKKLAQATADFEKKAVEIKAAHDEALKKFEAQYDHTNVALTTKCASLQIGLDKQAKKNDELRARLNEQRSQPTQPPSSQLAKDNENLANKLVAANAEVAGLKTKVADLEAKLAQASTIVPTGDVTAVEERIQNLEFDVCAKAGEIETLGSKIDQLKRSLDKVTGERNQVQEKFEGLEKEVGQIIQSRTASEARAEQAKTNQTGAEEQVRELQSQLDELRRKPATTTPGLDGAEVIAANLRAAQAEERCKTLVAEKDAKIAELEAKLVQNGSTPQVVAVSVRGYEETIQRLRDEVSSKEETLSNRDARIDELQNQQVQVANDAAAKQAANVALKREITRLEGDLEEVVATNVRLVRENQELEGRNKLLLTSVSSHTCQTEKNYGDLVRDRLSQTADSAMKLAQDPPAGDPDTAEKSADVLSSTEDSKLTPEEPPQAKHDSVFTSLVKRVETALGPYADQDPDIQVSEPQRPVEEDVLKTYVESDEPWVRDPLPTLSEALPADEQLTHPRMAVLPPISKDVSDTIPPRPSSPPPMDFGSMPDEILSGFFRSSLMEVGTRRLRGERHFSFEVTGRNDIYCLHEAINVPLVWSVGDERVQDEFGSPRLLIDCQGTECRKPQNTVTKTAAMPGIGG